MWHIALPHMITFFNACSMIKWCNNAYTHNVHYSDIYSVCVCVRACMRFVYKEIILSVYNNWPYLLKPYIMVQFHYFILIVTSKILTRWYFNASWRKVWCMSSAQEEIFFCIANRSMLFMSSWLIISACLHYRSLWIRSIWSRSIFECCLYYKGWTVSISKTTKTHNHNFHWSKDC